MSETIGNPQLESEYIASLYLKENILSEEYVDLRMTLAGLSGVSVNPNFNSMLLTLKDEISTPFGLLNDSVMDRYIQGKDQTTLKIVVALHSIIETSLPLIASGIQQKEMIMVHSAIAESEQESDYEGVGLVMNKHMAEQQELDILRQSVLDLYKLNVGLKKVISLYGVETTKAIKKKEISTDTKQYLMYLIQLQLNFDDLVVNPQVAMTLGKALDAIGVTKPESLLDPYKTEVFKNVIDELVNPKDFYNDCKNEGLVSEDVGLLFSSTYPEFYNKFLSMYIDEYEDMTYQEQINFRKCFALPADDSDLLALTNTYIKMSYTT